MTIKDFAKKYNIPYHLAYKATYRVKPTPSMRREKDYDEEDLRQETIRYTQMMADRYKKRSEEYSTALLNLNRRP